MGIVDAIGNAVDALYMHKKEFAEFQRIKSESGLMNQDWNVIWESISRYPVEVQTVLEAKNEDHVNLYDQDVRDVLDIQEETKQLLNDEVPDLFWIDFFRTIQLHTCDPIVTIFETEKSKHIDMNNLLYGIQNFLYGGESGRDIQLDTQILFNNFENLYDDSIKNVRIAQKGKTGEDYVGNVLRQCGGNFHFLENIVIPAYEESGNTSETDVYIINRKGIFVCEVKNYGDAGQTLYMPNVGEWQLLNAQGRVIANKPSAFVQNERHCNATKSFIKEHLGIEVPIYSVIIIANDYVKIQNENPYEHVVIKAPQIGELVQHGNDAIDDETQKKIVETFEEHKLDANDFPVKINADRARYLQSLVKNYIPYLKANEKMAHAFEKGVKKRNKIAWGITIVLAILGMMPLVKEGEWLVVLIGLFAWGGAYYANTKISAAFSIAAVILLPIWIITLMPQIGALGLVCMGLGYWLTDKEDKKRKENNGN